MRCIEWSFVCCADYVLCEMKLLDESALMNSQWSQLKKEAESKQLQIKQEVHCHLHAQQLVAYCAAFVCLVLCCYFVLAVVIAQHRDTLRSMRIEFYEEGRYLKSEKEALDNNEYKVFEFTPENIKNDKLAQTHFRLAESQFLRMVRYGLVWCKRW